MVGEGLSPMRMRLLFEVWRIDGRSPSIPFAFSLPKVNRGSRGKIMREKFEKRYFFKPLEKRMPVFSLPTRQMMWLKPFFGGFSPVLPKPTGEALHSVMDVKFDRRF